MQAQDASGAPHLRKQGTATQLIVDGKPFLALAGELGNNSATSLENMEPVWPKIVAGNLNTALVGISWAQFEPEEGKFDYSLVDGVIAKARENNLHIIFLWFASWKNGTSSYPPIWVKRDYQRFPRIQINKGSTVSISGPVELLSTLGNATRDADAAAFGALMRHIKEVDGTRHTVLMMQVENEVGVLRDTRDRSAAANRAFAGHVPAELDAVPRGSQEYAGA
jgi:beta-galactosidase GanA